MALPMNEALKGNQYNRIIDHDYIIFAYVFLVFSMPFKFDPLVSL